SSAFKRVRIVAHGRNEVEDPPRGMVLDECAGDVATSARGELVGAGGLIERLHGIAEAVEAVCHLELHVAEVEARRVVDVEAFGDQIEVARGSAGQGRLKE